jgi:O-antigen ligase
MRRAAVALCLAVLLGGPTALAFFFGGYYDRARTTAGIVAWALVLAVAVVCERPLPRRRAGRLALAGLGLLLGLTALSMLWAPLAGPAFHDAQRLALYLAALIAAAALLRERAAARAVDPVVAAGAAAVVAYGLSARLLPGVVELEEPFSAAGRLVEPLGYWNAMGLLAAIGFVLAARVAGDGTRREMLRVAAAAAAVPLGVGLYLSFSRGALAALAAGLVVLLAAAARRPQVRATAIALASAGVAAVAAAQLRGVESLAGGIAAREKDGAVMLVVLVGATLLAGVVQLRVARGERTGRLRADALTLPRRAPVAAGLIVVLAVGAVVAAGSTERRGVGRGPSESADPARLASLRSHRYSYWDVALRSFADHPLRGVGSGGFAVVWLRERKARESAQDAHSLYVETAAELGLAGLAALALMLAGVFLSAQAAWRRDPTLAAGWCAALATWAFHAGIDWDWEMPAVTLLALILAGAVVAAAECEPQLERP